MPSITDIPHYLKSNSDCVSYDTLSGYAPATRAVALPMLTRVELSQPHNQAWGTLCPHLTIRIPAIGRQQFRQAGFCCAHGLATF